MILNSSSTARCDQILKQMMYGGRKLERRKSLGERERKREREKKKIRRCRGITFLILICYCNKQKINI